MRGLRHLNIPSWTPAKPTATWPTGRPQLPPLPPEAPVEPPPCPARPLGEQWDDLASEGGTTR